VTQGRRSYLTTEFVLLFFILPGALALARYVHGRLPFVILPMLWIASVLCLLVMHFQGGVRWSFFFRLRSHWRELIRVIAQWAVLAAAIAALTAWLEPDRLFGFARERPRIWLMVMCLYPIFSAFPQTIIWRAFLFHRYQDLFPDRWAIIAASAVTFSFSHLLFQNWWAIIFTLIGGVLFAWTYVRTRSVLLSAIEHALYGDFIFAIGLGWYFYHGAS
jgi:membrane protease YdiL (CAAX protease family)